MEADEQTKTEESAQREDVSDLFKSNKPAQWKNRQRTLIVCSRGVAPRHRHLMGDLINLVPHSKKDAKIEKKEVDAQILELCEMHTCENFLYFDTRKKKDLFMWLGKAPNGPCVKFHVENIHTSQELKLTGNCLRGSRPILSFDSSFEKEAPYILMKELFTDAFNVPRYHPKSKPFIDHAISFLVSENRIWFRNYQIHRTPENKKLLNTDLIEIGPRYVLNPVVILDGCLNGEVLFQNPHFVNPNKDRLQKRKEKNLKYYDKMKKKKKREDYLSKFDVPVDEIEGLFSDEEDNDKDNE